MRRRSLKLFANVSDIMNNISDRYSFIFATFTIPNCYDYELNTKIDLLNDAFVRLTHRKKVQKINLGAFRVLEITYNKKKNKLKKGKIYYYKVRAFVYNEDGTKVYSAYSSVKKVKFK